MHISQPLLVNIPRYSFTLINEFNVNLTIEKLPPNGRTPGFCYAM